MTQRVERTRASDQDISRRRSAQPRENAISPAAEQLKLGLEAEDLCTRSDRPAELHRRESEDAGGEDSSSISNGVDSKSVERLYDRCDDTRKNGLDRE